MLRSRKLQTPISPDMEPEIQKVINGKKVFIIQSSVFLICCLIIGRAWGGFFSFFKSIGTTVGSTTKSVISSAIGDKPITDVNGNINIALLGYGGGNHDGTYLTDAIIIASINPVKGTMSMLSVPRDLYIKKPLNNYGRINSLYEQSLYRYDMDVEKAAADMREKLHEITNIDIPYYAMIDFAGFEKFIDSLGGVTLNVPERIYDAEYPGPNNSYTTFSIDSGEQTLNGATALKYARSRHSTSDFSRSMRQQAIIQAIIDSTLSSDTILHPGRVKDLYNNFHSFVKTNINASELLWGIPYFKSLKHKASWQIAACGASNWTNAQAGCLLYTPPLETFGGASVQVPIGASPANVSKYDRIHEFVYNVVMNHDFIQEGPTVRVLNGISTGSTNPTAKKLIGKPLANNVAIDLIEQGFTVYDAKNADVPQLTTTITTNGEGRKASRKKLATLFPGVTITQGPEIPDGPSIIIIIGEDYNTIRSGDPAQNNATD